MAKIQISWRDNADNEDKFKIYRSGDSTVTTGDTLIAEVEWMGSSWDVTGSGSNLSLTSSNGGPSATGEIFTLTYDENVAGTYYYGVSASNAVGDSAIAASSVSVVVQ